MNTKARGDIGEQLAKEYLEEKGYRILFQNKKYAGCEVDIIAECYVDESGNLIRSNHKIAQRKPSKLLAKIKAFFGVKEKKKTFENKSAKGERTIVFCEVKTRTDDEHGAPEEAVDGYKKGRYVTAAKAYQSKYGEQNTAIRFDVIAVEDGEVVNHIENAFTVNDARYAKRQ